MPRLPLSEIRRRYVDEANPLPSQIERDLEYDPRAGARAILVAIEKRRFANRAEGQRLRSLVRFETALWNEGLTHVAGVDEAGMSPLAGPVAAAAVVFSPGTRIVGVDDSKKLSATERARLEIQIKSEALAWSVAFAEVGEIDEINIYRAGLLAMRRAVESLGVTPQHLLIDGRQLKDLPVPQRSIVGGDAKSHSIAAASILAKTARDRLMQDLDAMFPGYGFAKHKGYPVQEHRNAILRLGVTPVHRRSFAFVRMALGLASGERA